MRLNILPEGWVNVTLADICSKPQYGYTTKSQLDGNVKFLRTTDITKGFLDWDSVPYCEEPPTDLYKYQLYDRDIVISRAGSIGFSALIKNPPEKVVFASYLIRFKPSESISEVFIKHFLNSHDYWTQLRLMSAGNAVQNVNAQKLSILNVPLPPMPEQKIIADKLDELLARVESIKARLVNIPEVLKRFRQSVLNAAVNGNLTEEWRNNNCCSHNPTLNIQIEKKKWVTKNPKHNEVKRVIKRLKEFNGSQNEVGEKLPEGWSWQKLEDSVLMIVDCHNKTAPYIESGIPIVRTSNIRDGNLNWEGMKYVGREIYEYWSRRCPPEAGDIIFTREAPMGEATIIPQGQQLCLGQRTMLIRTIEKYVKAKFILTVLMSPSFRTRAESFAVGTGVKHYRVGDVSNLFIPVPPTEEQNEIVRRVDQIFGYADSIQQMTDSALERIDNMTHSILAKAFRGELTAQWREENSELISGLNSAEALLKRIAVEKMECSISKKRVKKSNH